MSASDLLENNITTIIEILSVLIATALTATRSRDELRQIRAETVQRECTTFLQLLQDRDLEDVEDRYEDIWEQTMDNFEASNRYLKDLDMSNMSDAVSPEFEIWRKMSREQNNLLEWLPRLKQSVLSRAKRSPSLSYGTNPISIAPSNRPRALVRHSFSDFSQVNTVQSPFASVHSQMRSRTYPQPNASQIGSSRNGSTAGFNVGFRESPNDNIAGVAQGLSGLSINSNPNGYRPPYQYSNSSSMNGSVGPHNQQYMRRQSIDLPPSTIPIYAYPNSSPSGQAEPPLATSAPTYNYPYPPGSSPMSSSPIYNHANSSRQSINTYPTRPSFPISNSSQQALQRPADYPYDGPRTLNRNSSRQSLNSPPTQYEPVPFENDSRPPPSLRRSSSRQSLDSIKKPLRGILKNSSSRTSSTDDYQSPQISGFAPGSHIPPETTRHALRRSWSTTATVGSGTPSIERQRGSKGRPPVTDRFHLPRFTSKVPGLMSPGASSSSTVPFLDLEHEPLSRYPTTQIAPTFPGGYQNHSPILIVLPEKKKHLGHKKDKDGKHHHKNVLTKSKDKEKEKEKKRHKA
ncbi:hypothetical protein L218DRAFT_1075926 [Marasmius fiardii PR-910]|nr:hypothetical protein L218DRAFT_1075926 [Marasmius fiardii PR-910]